MTLAARISARQLALHTLVFLSGVIIATTLHIDWQSLPTSSNFEVIETQNRQFGALTETLGSLVSTILQPMIMLSLAAIILSALAALIFVKRDHFAVIFRASDAPVPTGIRPDTSSWKTELEIEEIMQLIVEYRGENERYADAIQSKNEELSNVTKAAQVIDIVRDLVSENKNFQKKTQELDNSLKQSQSQLAVLRTDLTEARQESLQDQLTSIGNRRLFDLVLEDEIAKARQHNTDLSLIMTDIDKFKTFNDEYGHQMGDEVLATVARIMKSNVKGRDTATRYGGEEFALILPETSAEDASTLANQIRIKISKHGFTHRESGEPIRNVTSSFGIAAYRPNEEAESLIKRADTKLYDAKKAGRNRVLMDAEEVRTHFRTGTDD